MVARKQIALVMSLITCMIILAVGCTNKSASVNTGIEANASTENIPAEQHPGQADRSVSGGTFTFAVSEDAIILGNPPTIMKQSDPNYAAPAVERLFRRDQQGEPEPYLAESYNIADDNLSITIELKQGVKFHDGSDFNAHVVKWNLDRYIATERAELAKVQSVEAAGDYTVKLHLKEFDGMLLQNLSGIPGMMVSQKSVEENGEAWAEMNPIGTGAYQFVSWDRDQRIVFKRFEGYWQGTPELDKLVIEVIVDPFAQKASFETGGIDAIMSLGPKDANELKQADKYNIEASDLASSVLGLLPDSAHSDSVYSNVKVRQAVWHAINFEAIAETMGYGYHEATFQLATEASTANNPNVKGYPYDPERAKALLKEAGYADGFATTLYAQNTPGYSDILTAVQAFLQEVGITAKVELVDQGKYFEMLTGGPEKGGWKNGLTIVPFTIVPNELGAYARLLGPGVSAARLPVVYNPDELQDFIGKASNEPDPAKAKSMIHDMQKVATDDHAAFFWIYATKNISATQPYVKGANFNAPQWTPEQIKLEE